MTKLRIAALALGLWLVPALAQACPVCAQADDEESQVAFVASTAFLSLLPLGMIGGLVWWVRRRTLLANAAESEQRASGPFGLSELGR